MQPLCDAGRRWRTLVAAAVVLAAAVGLGVLARAQTYQGSKPGCVLLDEDLTKLGIVVMANQTPITQADAQAVLPVLEAIQAQLEEQRQTREGPDDEAAAALDAQLRAALSPEVLGAVDVVRLLAPAAPPRPEGPPGTPDAADSPDQAPPPPPGPGHERGPRGGPGRGGMTGIWMLGPLTDFFRTTAAG